MHDFLSRIFEWSYSAFIEIAVLILLIWSLLALLLRKHKNAWRIVNIVGLLLAVAMILYVTLINRSEGKQILRLIPFSSFELAKQYHDVYTQIIINVILFMPIGLTLPFILQNRKHAVLWTILCALAFSTAIEAFQFIFSLGEVETDDVIFNTLGTAIGALPYVIIGIINKRTDKNGS